MKLLIASDIHGDVEGAKYIFDVFKNEEFDKILLLGDLLYFGPRNTLTDNYNPDGAVTVVTSAATIYIPMKELMDFAKELERLEKDLAKAVVDKEFFEKKLNNPGFVAKAPEKLVAEQKEQLAKVLEKIENLEAGIADIKKQM